MINHILAPLDYSALAEYVLPHVTAIAQVMNARVTLLHVMEYLQNENGIPAVDPADWHLRKRKAEKYLEQMADQLQKSDLTVEYAMPEGSPADCIIEFAHNNNVDLIALSTHGRSGLSGWNVSSVVQKVLLRSYKSTLLVRAYNPMVTGPSGVHYKRIFIGLDCSPRAEYTLPVAMSLAQSHKSELVLGTVIQRPQAIHRFPISNEDAKLVDQIVEKNRKDVTHYLEQLLAQFSLKGLELKTEIVVGDNAIAALHDMAEQVNADLVMLSAHGYSGEKRWPYGSVTTSFIAYGNTPLMIMQDISKDEIPLTYAELAARESKGH